MDIVNVVASEGEDRIEWYKVAGKWRARMMMAGFAPRLMGTTMMDTLGNTVYEHYEHYICNDHRSSNCTALT
ncbi:Scarecrow-like protein 1 [Linum perenne]